MGTRRRPVDFKTIKVWVPKAIHAHFDKWCRAAGNTMQFALRTMIEKESGYKKTLAEIQEEERLARLAASRQTSDAEESREGTPLDLTNRFRRSVGLKEYASQEEADVADAERTKAEIAETHRKLDEHWKFTKSFTNSRRECEEMSRSQMDGHVGWDSWVPPDDGWGDL